MSAPDRPMQESWVEASVRGRVLSIPATASSTVSADGSPLLVGFHGYGETADDHFRELLAIPGIEGWSVAAVQGLHAFYRSRTGEVVASWMTSFNRERMIEDNRRYVARAVEELRGSLNARGPLVFAGFSQGVAMAYRAVGAQASSSAEPLVAAGVIALAGDVPPEIAGGAPGSLPPVLLGQGSADSWYTAEKLDADRRALESLDVEVEECRFQGGHVWTDAFRERAGAFLARVAAP